MPKATYMYWQKRFDRENPDKEIEEKLLQIRKTHKDYGYRRMVGELQNQGLLCKQKESTTYNAEAWFTGYFFHSKKP